MVFHITSRDVFCLISFHLLKMNLVPTWISLRNNRGGEVSALFSSPFPSWAHANSLEVFFQIINGLGRIWLGNFFLLYGVIPMVISSPRPLLKNHLLQIILVYLRQTVVIRANSFNHIDHIWNIYVYLCEVKHLRRFSVLLVKCFWISACETVPTLTT